MSREDLRISPAWAAIVLSAVLAAGGGLKTLLADYATKADLQNFATKDDIDSLDQRWSRKQEGTDARLDILLLRQIPENLRPSRDRSGRRP